MSSKILTYFFGFDYEEGTPLSTTANTLKSIAQEITPLLLPDKVQFKKRVKSVVFVNQVIPYQGRGTRELYYVYQVESTIFESDLSQLITRYDIHMTVKIFSFMTGVSAIFLTLLFLFQKVTGVNNRFYDLAQDFYFLIPIFILLKLLVGYFIYADIEAYREKLYRL
jgi:hypothetical protein